MDLLKRKANLLTICLLGAMVLVADEDESEETPQERDEKIERAVEPNSPENNPASEPAPSPTRSTQSTELKPLELQERIRAHANIDLPQDI